MGEKMKWKDIIYNKKDVLVYAYVCGDILHEGHLLQLENAKAMGDKLIVGVLTDAAVMEKKVKPIISFAQRMRLVQAVGVVDAVVPQHDYSPIPNVKSLGVDILMESASHIGNKYLDDLKDLDVRVIMTPYYPGQSSTDIKEKIKNGK